MFSLNVEKRKQAMKRKQARKKETWKKRKANIDDELCSP